MMKNMEESKFEKKSSSSDNNSSESEEDEEEKSLNSKNQSLLSESKDNKLNLQINTVKMSRFSSAVDGVIKDKEDEFDEDYPEEEKSPLKQPSQPQNRLIIESMEDYMKKEEEIIEICRENKCLWTDSSFPPDNRSLFKVSYNKKH